MVAIKMWSTDDNLHSRYSKGILYQRIGQRDLALECFIESIRSNQFNWSCWLSIAACVSSTAEVSRTCSCRSSV